MSDDNNADYGRLREPCAQDGCDEQVVFSLTTGFAVRSDEPKYFGTCANGHTNYFTPRDGNQWVDG